MVDRLGQDLERHFGESADKLILEYGLPAR